MCGFSNAAKDDDDDDVDVDGNFLLEMLMIKGSLMQVSKR